MRSSERQYALTWPRHQSLLRYGDTCKVCGVSYCKDSPDDRREHQRRHRHVLAVYEPKPAPEFFGRGPFLEVTEKSREKVRNHLESTGRMFRREYGSSSLPYSAAEANDRWSEKQEARHFLLVDPEGRPIGGTSVRRRSCVPGIDPSGFVWLLAWIWVVPSERRKGRMAATWDMVKSQVPGIVPEPPFSIASASFFVNRLDVPGWVREAARSPRLAGDD